MVGSGTPVVTAATPYEWRRPRGAGLRALDAGGAHECGHLAVRGLAGDGPQGPLCASGARLCPSEAVDPARAHGRASGTGTARQWLLRRFRVAIRTSRASRSTETRAPVIARVWARVWTAGLGCVRTAARKRSRSPAVKSFRPRASTRENVLSGRDRKVTLLFE